MGKLILCSGERTKKPYGFVSTGVRVYSMEELCFYLYHHVYLIEEEIYQDALIDWIGTELKLDDRAQKLKQLKKSGADAKSMVTVVLCSADYYTEAEIIGLLKSLDDIIGMPTIKRNCIKAAHCLEKKQYKEAVAEYERILYNEETTELSVVEYGDILHNLAVAKVHTTGLEEAVELFEQAYVRNRKEDTLRQYLYALQLSGKEKLYQSKIEEYQVEPLLHQSVTQYLMQINEMAKECDMMKELEVLKQLKVQGSLTEYKEGMLELLDIWKEQLRKG